MLLFVSNLKTKYKKFQGNERTLALSIASYSNKNEQNTLLVVYSLYLFNEINNNILIFI
jgi:hypothetical protein